MKPLSDTTIRKFRIVPTTRNRIILVVAALALSFAFGRYTARPANVDKKETTKTDTVKDIDKDTKKKTIVTETPDGKKVTTIDEETITKTKETKEQEKKFEEMITAAKRNTNISALLGYDLSSRPVPIYGASFSREFLGPVTIGAFGLMNGVIGISIGINF